MIPFWIPFIIGIGLGIGLWSGLLHVTAHRSRADGHRSHTIIPLQGQWYVASCECGYTERCASVGAAEGALSAHLRTARPWEHYAGRVPCPGPGDDTHRVLTPEEAATLLPSSDPEAVSF